MKKLILTLLAAIALCLTAAAQNANRSGIFLEIGAGGVGGQPPAFKYSLDQDILKAHTISGFGADFSVGYRYATSSFCAIEIKAKALLPTKDIENFITLCIMPGFRYTSRELFGNISLFLDINAGVAFGNKNYCDVRFYAFTNYQEDEIYTDLFVMPGFSYELSAGLNFTSNLYAGVFWNGLIVEQIREVLGENLHWGLGGVRLGYRF